MTEHAALSISSGVMPDLRIPVVLPRSHAATGQCPDRVRLVQRVALPHWRDSLGLVERYLPFTRRLVHEGAKVQLAGEPFTSLHIIKVGKVEDLIITPGKFVSYVIIGAGGFVGIGRHDVAVPMAQIVNQDGRITMPGATKDLIKAMTRLRASINKATS